MKYLFIIGAILFLNFNDNICYSQNCGKERWSIKTLSDKDTLKIDFNNIQKSTISSQKGFEKPFINSIAPRQITEDTVYSIECFLLAYKKEDDMDIHLLIKDLITQDTMVAEIPDAICTSIQQTSRWNDFILLNNWFIKNIGMPTNRFTYLNTPIKVQIIGVGFFDFMHGQKGMLKNGREIHPVLSMKKL
jgi:hypothetical protein